MENNATLDVFLKRLLIAPPAKRETAIQSALTLLDGKGKPPDDRILYNGCEAARQLNISYQSLWRLTKSGTIKPVFIKGMSRPRYARADLEKLAGGGK